MKKKYITSLLLFKISDFVDLWRFLISSVVLNVHIGVYIKHFSYFFFADTYGSISSIWNI